MDGRHSPSPHPSPVKGEGVLEKPLGAMGFDPHGGGLYTSIETHVRGFHWLGKRAVDTEDDPSGLWFILLKKSMPWCR